MSALASVSAVSVPSIPKPDFPTWLPPMLVKELRQGLRTRGFVGAVVIFQLLMVLMMLGTLVSGNTATAQMRASTFNGVNAFFWGMLVVQLLLGTPMRGLTALRPEIDSRSLDLLRLTRLSAWRIVTGKWGSLVIQAGLLLVSMLPYAVVRYFGGSVDLVDDAERCLAMMGGCAVITAIAVWASSLPRGMQIVVPIVVVALVQLSAVMRTTMPVFGVTGQLTPGLITFNGAVLTAFFLVSAVRRIAPNAENHAPLARILALLPLVAVPFCTMWLSQGAAQAQFVFAAFLLLLLCGIELSSVSKPMAVHWDPWVRRGGIGRLTGRFLMPGWASAFLFTVVATVLLAMIARAPRLYSNDQAARAQWLAVLALTALVFPAVLLDFFPRAAKKAPGVAYLLVFGALTVFAAVTANTADKTWMEAFASVVPVAGFWLTLFEKKITLEMTVGQGGVALAFLIVAFVRARIHRIPEKLAGGSRAA